MRVVGGRFGGRRLLGPVPGVLRPTADRVREALFNILGGRTRGALVLDLFAGVGSLGIEALSRGAAKAVFVERDRRALNLLRRNLAALRLGPEEAEVLAAPVDVALPRLAGRLRFDLIFADPPYDAGLLDGTLRIVSGSRLLRPGGLAVLEHRTADLPAAGEEWSCVDRRVYGDTTLSFLAPREELGDDA